MIELSRPLQAALLAAVALGVLLLAWRGYTRLDKKGELEPRRPVVARIGLVLALVGGGLLALTSLESGGFLASSGRVKTLRLIGAYVASDPWRAVSDVAALLGYSVVPVLLFKVAELLLTWRPIFGRAGPKLRKLFRVLAALSLLVALALVVTLVAVLPIHSTPKWVLGGLLLGAGVGYAVAGSRAVPKGLYRALVWWWGALVGVTFGVTAAFTVRMPTGRFESVTSTDQIIRFTALASSVVFLFFVLSALLPIILDALERGSFVPYVGARHVRASKSGFLTVISVLSMAGVGVSSCALCSVTSIMGGFGADLKRKILGNNAHMVVDVSRPGGFGDWDDKLTKVRVALAPYGGAATPVVAGEAMGSSASNTAGALVRGIDPDTIGQVIDLKKNIEVGTFDYLRDPEKLTSLPPEEIIGRGPGGEPYFKGPDFRQPPDVDPSVRDYLKQQTRVYPGVIIGRELAKSLHVLVGDEVTLLSPMGELGPTGVMPRSRRFRVAAIFYSGMYEYDVTHAYVLMEEAQKFFSLEDRITHIDIRVPDPERVQEVRPAVEAAIAASAALDEAPPDGGKPPPALRVRDWMEMNRNLFSALKLEKIATFIILSIAIAVASFCIVCTLLLMVTEKGKEIAVLKALGASDSAVMRVFMLEGVIIGAIGTVYGVGTALAACTGLSWFGVRLDPDVYYIDRLPVNVNLYDYGVVALASMLICTIATIYPARAASKLSPVDGLRYE
ncbi:FtsX-like permease family protein [Sorangium sp. So ce1078]|uniref:FtsX-like permease family protein n=1 Tax=Sorangium sp. So ce1078 TaxID=3133329 RepID=UPI003F61A64F